MNDPGPISRDAVGGSPISRAFGRAAAYAPSLAACLAAAAIAGMAQALYLFGLSAISGRTPFWQMPTAIVGDALDIRNTLSGYWWFVNDGWHWPLMAMTVPNAPDGANLIRFDAIPALALIGRLVSLTMDRPVNILPLWVSACFALNAMAMALLVRALGQRTLMAAVVAAGFAATAPMVLFRFGHLALMAHWLPVFMLAVYFSGNRGPGRALVIVALCVLAAWVHLYLFVMTAAIGSAALLDDVLTRRRGIASAAATFALMAAASLLTLWIVGLFHQHDLLSVSGDYRRYSMNLVSPFWPQASVLGRWTGIFWLGRGIAGATPGQYEGFCYLGAGGLVLLATSAWTGWRDAGHWCRGRVGLIAALAVLTAVALTDRIWLGPSLIVSYEMPPILTSTVLGWFRSVGRFFWPAAWLILALGIAGTMGRLRPSRALAVAIVALTLQWIDTGLWRARIQGMVAAPGESVFGSLDGAARAEAAIRAAGAVVVWPPLFCSSTGDDYRSVANYAAMEIQVMAARSNARMNNLYLSRAQPDCQGKPKTAPPAVLILLNDPGGRPTTAPSGKHCLPLGQALLCELAAPP